MNKILESKKPSNELQQVLNQLFGKSLHVRAWMQDNVDLSSGLDNKTGSRNCQ